MKKIKNPNIQSFDKENKETSKKSKKEKLDSLENFMKLYKSKSKISISQIKSIISK